MTSCEPHPSFLLLFTVCLPVGPILVGPFFFVVNCYYTQNEFSSHTCAILQQTVKENVLKSFTKEHLYVYSIHLEYSIHSKVTAEYFRQTILSCQRVTATKATNIFFLESK